MYDTTHGRTRHHGLTKGVAPWRLAELVTNPIDCNAHNKKSYYIAFFIYDLTVNNVIALSECCSTMFKIQHKLYCNSMDHLSTQPTRPSVFSHRPSFPTTLVAIPHPYFHLSYLNSRQHKTTSI